MAYAHHIAEISPTAGDDADGSLIGRVPESNFTGAFTDVRIAAAVTAYRKDVAGSTFSFENLSTPLNNATTGDALPFGSTAQMSAGDKFYISCDHKTKALYFKVSTPGVWTGTMTFKCSTDGITENHTIAVVDDGSNGFRNSAGVYKITPTLPENMVAFSPVPGDVPSKLWIVFMPSITGSPTTAPVLTQAWIEHEDSSVTHINLSTSLNDDILGSGGTNHPPEFLPVVGSIVSVGFASKPKGMVKRVFQRCADVRTRVVEYLASDDTWKTLAGLNDPSGDYENGPATLTRTNITGITRANPCVVTAAGHGRSIGDRVHLIDVVGMTQVNGQYYQITAVNGNNVTLNVDSSAFTTYTSSGKMTLFNLYNVTITAPVDWVAKAQTFKPTGGDVTVTAFWLRERTTAVSTYGPAQTVYANVKAKKFGFGNVLGIKAPIATTIRALTLEEPASSTGSGAVGLQIANLITGASVAITIPASPTWPLNLDITDIALAANDEYGIFYTSGTRVFTSVSVIMHT